MRTLMLLVWLIVAGTVPGIAQGVAEPSPSDRAAIRDVITHQLDAFKRDDANDAYSYAAPNVRTIFPTPEVFMDMVRRGYPAVYRPASREFSELGLRDGELVQEVELTGPDGRPVLALYTMQKLDDGTWRIAACTLISSVRTGV